MGNTRCYCHHYQQWAEAWGNLDAITAESTTVKRTNEWWISLSTNLVNYMLLYSVQSNDLYCNTYILSTRYFLLIIRLPCASKIHNIWQEWLHKFTQQKLQNTQFMEILVKSAPKFLFSNLILSFTGSLCLKINMNFWKLAPICC